RCVHSHAWQPRKAKPPRIVQPNHFSTPFLSISWPEPTANTMVTELMIRMKVIKLTNSSGICISPMIGNDLNTWLGSGQELVEKRMVPYEIKNAPKVKASLIKKNHIISLPYSTLYGLLPPDHMF